MPPVILFQNKKSKSFLVQKMLVRLPSALLVWICQMLGVRFALLRGCSRALKRLLDPSAAPALWQAVGVGGVEQLLLSRGLTPAGADFLHGVYHFEKRIVAPVLTVLSYAEMKPRLDVLEWALHRGLLDSAAFPLPPPPCAHIPDWYRVWHNAVRFAYPSHEKGIFMYICGLCAATRMREDLAGLVYS